MTPFEITITILAVLIVLLMGFIAYRVTTIWDANNFIHLEIKKVLNNIDVNTATPIDILRRMDKQLATNESTVDQDLQELIRKLDDISTRMYLHQDNLMKDELMKQINEKIQSFEPFPPCYARDGICTNPQRDCVNCPKQYGGGTYTSATTGICQDCNGKTICKHYDVNRNRCFVADSETTNNE